MEEHRGGSQLDGARGVGVGDVTVLTVAGGSPRKRRTRAGRQTEDVTVVAEVGDREAREEEEEGREEDGGTEVNYTMDERTMMNATGLETAMEAE